MLTRARQSRQNDLLGLPLDHLPDRHPLDPLLRKQSLERRRFQDAQPDVKPHGHHHDAEQERYPPAPDEELVAGKPTEEQHRQIGEQETAGAAQLRP